MDWRMIEDNWQSIKWQVMQHWNVPTAKQIDMTNGKRDQLIDLIHHTYQVDLLKAEQTISNWQKELINIDGHFY